MIELTEPPEITPYIWGASGRAATSNSTVKQAKQKAHFASLARVRAYWSLNYASGVAGGDDMTGGNLPRA
jgi:hypothetical protein